MTAAGLGDRVAPGLGWLLRRVLPWFRRRRMAAFAQRFSVTAATRVLDVGGVPLNWRLLETRPRVTILNLELPGRREPDFDWVLGDGRALPFADRAFDVVYSNSVIEHIGHPEDQARFALELQRVGASYYLQTPNAGFFFEPHLLAPFIHWLPKGGQKRLIRWATPLGWLTRPGPRECEQFVEGTRLLGEREIRALFPEAEIGRERFLGMTKAWVVTGPRGR